VALGLAFLLALVMVIVFALGEQSGRDEKSRLEREKRIAEAETHLDNLKHEHHTITHPRWMNVTLIVLLSLGLAAAAGECKDGRHHHYELR
jgi:Mg2+/citrate symporter